jgi:hypothetical protein
VKVLHVVALAALTTGAAVCGTRAAGQQAGTPASAIATAIPAGTATASSAVAGTASSPPVPQPGSPPLTLTGPVTLTTADNGGVVRLQVGQQVAVALASEGLFSWDMPAAVGASVRRVSAGGGYPGRAPARAAFLAVRSGCATPTAIDDTACLHAQPACAPAQQEWRVTVTVTGG